MLVDANGNARSWNVFDQFRLGDRAVSCADSLTVTAENTVTCADPEYTAEIKLIDDSDTDPRIQPVYKDCIFLSLLATPPLLIGLVALLFAAGTSAIVAFIPLQVGSFGLLVFSVVIAIKENGGISQKILFMGLFGVPLLSLLTFCITYPLALDGTIPNETPGDWAAAISPLFIWSGLITFMLPCVGLVALIIRLNDHRLNDHDDFCRPWTAVIASGTCCVFGIVGVFNLCLIALCYKGADDWNLMSYAGFAGTIIGAMVSFVLCSVFVVVMTDKY